MEIFKILILGLICAIVIVYIKHASPEMAMPLTVCCGVVILLLTLSYVDGFISVFKNIASTSGIDQEVLKIILKIIAISYLVEFTSTLIEDFGLKSIADKVVFGGKILVLTMSAPIIENLITTVVGLI